MSVPAAASTDSAAGDFSPEPRPGHPVEKSPGDDAGTLGADPELHPEPAALAPVPSYSDDNVAKLSSWRRWIILFVVCWMAVPVTFMSTSIMTVNPEIAATFGTEPTAISTANAGVFVAMALSALIWLPVTTIIGRRSTYLVATAILTLCSLGCALSNNLATLTALWVISGTTGPFFLVAGQTILSDIFEPTVRGTAVGFFLGSTVSAQSITPMVGSIIATFTSWRAIFGVQGGMTFLGMALAFLFVPRNSELSHLREQEKSKTLTREDILHAFNPVNVFRLWKFPSILLANFSCGLLALNQYCLLSSVRHIINPLFNLTDPMYSGLFYLAPGVGFLAGSVAGGHISDRTVIHYKAKRDGRRLAEDRLNGSLVWVFLVLPLGTLLYGWSVERGVGGMGLPIASAFIEGFGLMAAFNGLNTYAAEVHPQFKAATISGKYIIQYSFGAIGVGSTVPMIEAVGVGWTFTFATCLSLLGGFFMLVIARCLVRETPSKPRARLFKKTDISS